MIITRPFILEMNNLETANEQDVRNVVDSVQAHEQRVKAWLKDEISSEDLEDSIRDLGHDPYEYWDVVEGNLDLITNQGILIEGADILLPHLYATD